MSEAYFLSVSALGAVVGAGSWGLTARHRASALQQLRPVTEALTPCFAMLARFRVFVLMTPPVQVLDADCGATITTASVCWHGENQGCQHRNLRRTPDPGNRRIGLSLLVNQPRY